MAKSARASAKKASRTKLRARVFGPEEHARLERLEKKLMDVAAQPKPDRADRMEVDPGTQADDKKNSNVTLDGDVDMDQDPATSASNQQKPRSKKPTRVNKRKHRKGSTSIIFPTAKKGRKVGSKGRR